MAPAADPPVCRLLDYSKFLYEKTRRDREARKAQKQIEVKEIRLKPKIAEHDVLVKANQARKFLAEGDKVRLRVRFRGREITHQDIARDLLDRVCAMMIDVAIIEQVPEMEGTTMMMVLTPVSKAITITNSAEVESAEN